MKLYNVANISGLFQMLDGSRAAVTVETADGSCFDWKTQHAALRAMTETLQVRSLSRLALHFADKKDANDVMYFLMECRKEGRKSA